MTRLIDEDKWADIVAFKERAKIWFLAHPEGRTFTDSGNIDCEDFLAIRWGMVDQAILVYKVSDYFETLIFTEQLPRPEVPK